MTSGNDSPDGPRPRRTGNRARLDRVFGDVLPSTTRDERDDETPSRRADSEEWLRAQVPPHHGGVG